MPFREKRSSRYSSGSTATRAQGPAYASTSRPFSLGIYAPAHAPNKVLCQRELETEPVNAARDGEWDTYSYSHRLTRPSSLVSPPGTLSRGKFRTSTCTVGNSSQRREPLRRAPSTLAFRAC